MGGNNSTEGLLRYGYTLQTVKEWRTHEHEAGRPSALDDFFRAHGLCYQCRANGRLVTGVRWRDSNGNERSEEGPVALLVQKHKLDRETKWLTDERRWEYLYESCNACAGTGKMQVK